MNKYQEQKEKARNKAINWQLDFNNYDYSYYELVVIINNFRNIGKRYGLLKEFRENGII